jgi:uncharacterized membrane protein YkoI
VTASKGAPMTLKEATANAVAALVAMADGFGAELAAEHARRDAEYQAQAAASQAEAEAEAMAARLELVDRLPEPLREAARAYLTGETARHDQLAAAAAKVDREAIDWQVAEDIAVREAPADENGDERWCVPGYDVRVSARPISPATLRDELVRVLRLTSGLVARWATTVEVCGDAGEDGMLDALMTAEAGLRRAMASERLRVIEQHAAMVGLASQRPEILAELRKLKSCTTETAVLYAAYAMLVMDAPGRGAVDDPGSWSLRMGDIDAGGAA